MNKLIGLGMDMPYPLPSLFAREEKSLQIIFNASLFGQYLNVRA